VDVAVVVGLPERLVELRQQLERERVQLLGRFSVMRARPRSTS
jgi:hypothetical protein